MTLSRAAILILVIWLGCCGPVVEGYRSVSGVDVNDPNPETAPFAHNLAAADTAPYPNLADVPPLPTRATTTAERQKLAQSLVADRNATAARAAVPPPTPPPGPAPIGVSSPQKMAASEPPSGVRRTGEPAETVSPDSTMVMPQVRSIPEPEAARPAPPAPALAALPRPSGAAAPVPAEIATAIPEPAPPVPVMAPIAPAPAAVRSEPKRPSVIATLDLAAGQDRADIERVAALYRATPGALRVIGYAAPPTPGGDPFGSYRAVLERTQAIARELADAGIPLGKIQTEAAPAAGGRAAGRIEIQFVP